MATSNQTQITPPRVSLIDERTGAVSRQWYRWFYSLYTFTGEGTGILPVTSGGTGLGTIPTNGQLLIGNGTGYTLNTLGAGAGISVTNGAGTSTVANTGVLSVSGGTTGLTPAAATTGVVTLAGTLKAVNGGTGFASYVVGNLLYADTTTTLAKLASGTGVITALGVNVGTVGAFVVNGGALGTPSSGTVTNLTGTASININGTVGATTANTGAFTSVSSTGNIFVTGAGVLGYGTGSGGAVTQGTSRTTGVTLSKSNGAITMFSDLGSAVAATFTVTNTLVAATDTIILNQKSGTNLYVFLVTAVAAGSFNITFYTTGGIATDAPVINFAVIKAVTA